MSYSNQTPYLGLPIRSASDTFNTLDNNDAFELTDAKVKEAVDNAAQATGDASDALTIAGEAKTIAEGAAGDIDGINTTLDEHAERLVILSNRQTSQAAAIKTKAASTSIGDLYDAEAGTYAVDDRIVYDGQLYQCVTAVTTPEDFDVAKWTPINVVDILPTPGGSIDAEDVSYNDTLTSLGVNDVQEAIVALKTLIDNIGGSTMKCAKFGVINFAASPSPEVVSISDLGLSSAEDYMVILSAGSRAAVAGGNTTGYNHDYLSAKTATSFTITSDISHAHACSYQVITFG